RRRGSESETQGPPPRDWPREAREETTAALLSSNRRSGAAFLGHDRLALPVPSNPREEVAMIEEPLSNLLLVLDFFVDQESHGLQDAIDLGQGSRDVGEVAVLRTRVVDRDEGEDRVERGVREREGQHVRGPKLQATGRPFGYRLAKASRAAS